MSGILDLNASGKILFFGTMNAMPIAYARELRKLDQDVVYFVDRPRTDTLSRPESHYPDVNYPYPPWIVEFVLRSQYLIGLFPRLVLWAMLRRAKVSLRDVKGVILSGPFVRLAPLLPADVPKVFLSYGSDLEVWCNKDRVPDLIRGMKAVTFLRHIPWLASWLIPRTVRGNFRGALACDAVVAFPRGVNSSGDAVLSRLAAAGVPHIPRWEGTFDHVQHANAEFRNAGGPLVILSAVRFMYRTFPEGTDEYSKGNDIIIRALARYRASGGEIVVHFFDKGLDVAHAKGLCDELGLSDVVTWHKQIAFIELVKLYETSDICFDQVGKHLVGAIGMIALYLGKPLIANASNVAFMGEMPILQASTEDEICRHLRALEDIAYRWRVSAASRRFAMERLGPTGTIDRLTQ